MTAFYQALERAGRITSAARETETQTQSQQKQKWQVRYDDKGPILVVSALHHGYINTLSYLFPQFPQDLLNQQQSCKRCLSVIERNHHTLQRALSASKVLRNFDLSVLQKRVAEIQVSAQVSVKQTSMHTHTRKTTQALHYPQR